LEVRRGSLIGLTLALVVCAVIFYSLTTLNPLKVYAAMFKERLAPTSAFG
jgi:hypothetical protein